MRLYQGPQLAESQEAKLVLPMAFELVELDGQKVASRFQSFRTDDLMIHMAPGPHTLTLRYEDVFEIDAESHETLSSGQIIFKGTFKAGDLYKIKTQDISTYEKALNFLKTPNVKLVSGAQTLSSSHIAKANPLILSKKEKPIDLNKPNLQQLKFWWQQATDFEKDAFQTWLNNSENGR